MEHDHEPELVPDDSAISLFMGINNGQPVAELMIEEEQINNTDRVSSDFLRLYLYLGSGIILNHMKEQYRRMCQDLNPEAYKEFKRKLDEEVTKSAIKASKPFITPLDVFRRGK